LVGDDLDNAGSDQIQADRDVALALDLGPFALVPSLCVAPLAAQQPEHPFVLLASLACVDPGYAALEAQSETFELRLDDRVREATPFLFALRTPVLDVGERGALGCRNHVLAKPVFRLT
jgi:hypothetical protein